MRAASPEKTTPGALYFFPGGGDVDFTHHGLGDLGNIVVLSAFPAGHLQRGHIVIRADVGQSPVQQAGQHGRRFVQIFGRGEHVFAFLPADMRGRGGQNRGFRLYMNGKTFGAHTSDKHGAAFLARRIEQQGHVGHAPRPIAHEAAQDIITFGFRRMQGADDQKSQKSHGEDKYQLSEQGAGQQAGRRATRTTAGRSGIRGRHGVTPRPRRW